MTVCRTRHQPCTKRIPVDALSSPWHNRADLLGVYGSYLVLLMLINPHPWSAPWQTCA